MIRLTIFESRFASDASGCLVWLGRIDKWGYGVYNGKRAHRVAYEAYVGPLDSNRVIDHLCRNRKCVNPKHLEQTTIRENVRRGNSPAGKFSRMTHCTYGHPYSDVNTHFTPQGYRVCRSCRRRNSNDYYRKYGKTRKGERS